MSKIFDLINELCPDGVEFKELGEIGYLYGGLSSKTKDDFVKHGNAKYITYMNVFLNLSIDTNALEYVKIDDNEKQNLVVYGDILFTGSSETRNECGFSSVFTKKIEEPIYLNSFCFGFRLNDLNLFDPEFLKYIFRSNFLRTQIIKTASGVTRFNVSKTKFLKIKLPVPPMEVQREIVCILDSFTLLTAELTARKKQYEFYRDFLLSFDELDKNGGGCELKMLGEIAEIASGGTPSTHNKIFWEKGTIPWLKSEVCKDCIIEKSSLFITESGLDNSSAKIFKKGTVLMAMVGATIFKMAFLNIEAATNQNIAGIKANNKILMDKFLFYFLVKSYPELISKLSGYNMVNLTQVKKIKIPVPSLQTQQKVVDILDKFDTLVNSITEGLPREIELRRKQYEHYRELLLNFKPKMTA